MKIFLKYLIQLTFLLVAFLWIISLNQKIDFSWDGIVFTGTASTILFAIILVIFLILIIQRVYLYIRHSPKRIKNNLEIRNYKKGISAIVKSFTAMFNNDAKELLIQSNKIENYLKDNPISLILKAEAARKAKKFDLAEQHYNKMLLDSNTKTLGLRGLLEQNLKKQDYHHALIYAEEIYNINSKLDWIYRTIIQILIRTKNWQKFIEINKDAYGKKIISKKEYFNSISIAKYEIALIKESFSRHESLKLLNEANSERPNFLPIVKKFANLLINNNQTLKAKKLLFKCWLTNPHQMLLEEIMFLVKKEDGNLINIVSKLIKNNSENYDSIVALTKANIFSNNWARAREVIKPILSSKPNRTICELMYEIEMGLSNNAQKANSWKSRALLGDAEKTWVCKHSGLSQDEWSSISQGEHFDSLEWTWPDSTVLNRSNYLIPNITESV